MKRVLGMCLLALIAAAAWASPVSFTTGPFYQENIGNEAYPGGFDKLWIGGLSALNLDVPGVLVAPVATYQFQAGINCTVCGPATGNVTFDFTVGPETQQIVMPYALNLGTPATGLDVLTVGGGAPLYFSLSPDVTLKVTALPLGDIPSHYLSNEVVTGDVMARLEVETPEPTSFALLGAGLAALAVLRKRA